MRHYIRSMMDRRWRRVDEEAYERYRESCKAMYRRAASARGSGISEEDFLRSRMKAVKEEGGGA